MLSHLRASNFYLLEVYIFLKAVSTALSALSLSLITQDKICLNDFQQSDAFCSSINKLMNSTAEQKAKDAILAESTTFGNYKSFTECIPMVVWSLFIGSFLDNYKSGTKVVLLAGIVGDLFALLVYTGNVFFYDLSKYYLLIGSINVWFTGGLTSYLTTIYSYIAVNTNESIRPIKFMLVRFSNIMGMSFGTFIGGQMIVLSERPSPQLRTYYSSLGLSIGLDLIIIGILVTLFWLTKDKDQESAEAEEVNENSEQVNTDESSNNALQKFVKTFFNLNNFRSTMSCFTKPRSDHVRMQIYLLYLVLISQVLIFFGINDVLLQFCEKVYKWNPKEYANLAAFSKITSTGLLALSSWFLVKKWALADGTIVFLALVSSFFSEVIIGTFLTPLAYYISVPIGSLSGFSLISIRSKLSKLVPKEEIGRILSLSSTLEAVIPFAASFVYSNLFALSISWYPSLIYHFSALVVLVSLVVHWFEEFY